MVDGVYELRVLASQVASLYGNMNVVPGDDYLSPTFNPPGTMQPTVNVVWRLFGDAVGDDRSVAANDFIQFRMALGGYNVQFDFNGNGSIDTADFIQFRQRFGGSLP